MDNPTGSPDRNGDIEALYRQHYGAMLDLALRTTRDQDSAEDACHIVFARLVTRQPKEAEISPIYLLVATRNACHDYLRAATRFVVLEDIHPAPVPPDTNDREQWVDALLAEWLDSLPLKQREAMERQLDGLSHQEIAEAMGCGVRSVGTHLRRARLKCLVLSRKRERERE